VRRRAAGPGRDFGASRYLLWRAALDDGAARPVEQASKHAARLLDEAGFTDVVVDRKPRRGAPVVADLVGRSADGQEWWFLVAGGFHVGPSGLRRADVLWRTLGRASALHAFAPDAAIAVLTTGLPTKGTPNDVVLRAVVPSVIRTVVDMSDPAADAVLASPKAESRGE